MKRLSLIAVILIICMSASAQRKSVGVVLSGGGAKGVAHIGVLKVLERAGIPIDYISGTSMGAIVGGLYSIGYDTKTLDSLVRSQDWIYLLTDKVSRRNMSFIERASVDKYVLSVPLTTKKKVVVPSGLVGGTNVLNLLNELTIGYHDSIEFNTLPIPFACVAYDMVTGKDIVLDYGNLATSIRASMSIPGAFKPVRSGDKVLVDGGIANNFPVDVAKKMGAEIIIGIDVGSGLRNENQLNTLPDLFDQITSFTGLEAWEGNKKQTNLYIHPDIKPYSAASFTTEAIDTLINRGEQMAMQHWDEIIALKQQIGILEGDTLPERPSINADKPLVVNMIRFEGLKDVSMGDRKQLMRIIEIKENSIVSVSDLHNAVTKLQGSGMFSDVQYRLDGKAPYDLTFAVKQKSGNSINLGIRFDTEEMAAILVNATTTSNRLRNSTYSVTGRLSANPYVKLGYSIGNEAALMFASSYMFRYNDINLYDHGNKLSNINFSYHQLNTNLSNIRLRNFQGTVGLRYEYFQYSDILTPSIEEFKIKSQGFVSYYMSAHYETLNSLYYPTRGLSFKADYTLVTNNFVTYDSGSPFSSIAVNLEGAVPISDRVTLLPALYGNILIGNNIAYPYLNIMGGAEAGRYLRQQLPFVGIHNIEMFDNSLLVARLDLRVRLWRKHYVSLKANYAKDSDSFFDILSGGDVFGYGLGYSYNSIIGPIDFLFDISNRDKKLGFYFNLGFYF